MVVVWREDYWGLELLLAAAAVAEEAQLHRSQASVGVEGVVVELACLTWFNGEKGGSDF